jgi:hypothetical protein
MGRTRFAQRLHKKQKDYAWKQAATSRGPANIRQE